MVLNIFRVEEYFDYNKLIEKINESIFKKFNKDFSSRELIYEDKNKKIKLYGIYGVTDNTNNPNSWENNITELFGLSDAQKKIVNSSYGLIIINYNDEIYIISFGRAYTLISEYIDGDFGLKMASKVMNEKTIKTQSSKFYSMAKSKSITEYNNTTFETDFSESVDCLRGDLQEYTGRHYIDNLSNLIKTDKVKFTTSMEVSTKNDFIDIDDLNNIIYNISSIYREYEERLPIPRLIPIRKSNETLLNILNNKLDYAIVNQEFEDAKISIAFYKLNNSIFIFEQDVEGYILYNERKSENNKLLECDNLTIESISECMKEYNIDSIQKIKVEVIKVDGYKEMYKLIDLIDVIITLENSNIYYTFDDGRWNRFNTNFQSKIEDEIMDINKKIVKFDSRFDYNEEEVKECINTNKEEFQEIIEKGYRELEYNFWISKKLNAILYDRALVDNLEICDLYLNNNNLVHVKFGTPSNFKDCIEQSRDGALDYINNREKVKNELGIDNVEKVGLVFITDNIKVLEEQDISFYTSLSMKISLIYWRKFVVDHGLEPVIIIGRKV